MSNWFKDFRRKQETQRAKEYENFCKDVSKLKE